MSPTLLILGSVIALTAGVGVLPDSRNEAVGGYMTLVPTEFPDLLLEWTFEGVTIATPDYTNPNYEGRITLTNSTGAFQIRNLSLSDAGNYSVTIVTTAGEVKSGSTTLNIYERVSNVRVIAADTDLVEFNDTVTLSCSASGSALSFRWFNSSAELKASDRVNFTNGGATVTIDPVLRYDDRLYSCKASNPVSSSTSDLQSLSISFGPDFAILEPTSEHYLSGSTAFMICIAFSKPSSQDSWFFNEKKLENTSDSLELVNIQMDQSGNYSCEAFNNITLRSIRSKTVPISVWVRIEKPSVKPSNEPVEGSPLNLTCDASGSILTREWTTDDGELKPSGNIEFFDEKRVLSFKKLTSEDNGLYTCKLLNPVSSASFFYRISIPSKGLSAGAIAGITIATVVVVAGAAAGGFYFFKHR